MKRFLLPMLLLLCVMANAQKPSLRLNVYTGYVFDDHVDSYYSNTSYYDGTVNGNFQWGAGLEYMIGGGAQGIELSYLRMDTKAPTTYYNQGVKFQEFDLACNWIFLGTTRYFKINKLVEPYFGGEIGLGIFNVSNPTNGKDNNATKFSWGLKGGSNFWVSDRFGIKVQAALQSATQAVGGGLYFGTGGVGAGVSSYSTIYQFSLGGGVAFRFGGGK